MDLGEQSGVSQRTNNPWKKHEWLMETGTGGQFPRKVKITVFGDRTNTVTFTPGQRYVVSVDIESREYNGRWFTDVQAYACRLVEGGNAPTDYSAGGAAPENPFANPSAPQQQFAQPQAPAQNPFSNPAPDFAQGNSQEDLPF